MEATTCALCKGFLLNKSRKGRAHSLTAIKDKGGLTFASDVLDYVIRYSEQRLINLLDEHQSPQSLSEVSVTLAKRISNELKTEDWFRAMYNEATEKLRRAVWVISDI